MQETPEFQSFLRRFEDLAGSAGVLPWSDFVRLALYDAEFGYYRQARPRVGRSAGTDFTTSVTSGREVFARLVAEAAGQLAGAPLDQLHWLELGAEPEGALLDGVVSPFASIAVQRVGEEWPTLAGPTVLFANEVLDAQPFERLQFAEGGWRILGVTYSEEAGAFREVVLPSELETAAVAAFRERLPPATEEGWRLDISLEAEELLRTWGAQPQVIAILTFDYGRDLSGLLADTPQGSARAYYQHQQERDLLARPGQQDLTCHVVWDRMEAVLRESGWLPQSLERQEAFLIRRAPSTVRSILEGQPGRFSEERQALQALLHPAHFGNAFQVLAATREDARHRPSEAS